MRWSEAEYARYIQNTEQNTSSPKPKINTLLKKLGLMVYVLTVKRKPIIIVS